MKLIYYNIYYFEVTETDTGSHMYLGSALLLSGVPSPGIFFFLLNSDELLAFTLKNGYPKYCLLQLYHLLYLPSFAFYFLYHLWIFSVSCVEGFAFRCASCTPEVISGHLRQRVLPGNLE